MQQTINKPSTISGSGAASVSSSPRMAMGATARHHSGVGRTAPPAAPPAG